MSTQYKVINSPRHDRFETQVTNLLNEGWELHGSPFVSSTGGMTQALIKTTKPVVSSTGGMTQPLIKTTKKSTKK